MGNLQKEATSLPASAKIFAFRDKPRLRVFLAEPGVIVEDEHPLQQPGNCRQVANLHNFDLVLARGRQIVNLARGLARDRRTVDLARGLAFADQLGGNFLG